MRRAARTDRNHTEIANALAACGARVIDLSAVGKGCPDMAVQHRGQTYWLEVKDGAKSASRRKLTPDQVIWHALSRAHDVPVHVVLTTNDALALIGYTTTEIERG